MIISDLRTMSKPTMALILPEGTTVHVCAPTVELVEELREGSDLLFETLQGADTNPATKKAVYELAAKFINCNLDLFEVTAAELATKYGLSLQHLKGFYVDYVNFLETIQNEKN